MHIDEGERDSYLLGLRRVEVKAHALVGAGGSVGASHSRLGPRTAGCRPHPRDERRTMWSRHKHATPPSRRGVALLRRILLLPPRKLPTSLPKCSQLPRRSCPRDGRREGTSARDFLQGLRGAPGGCLAPARRHGTARHAKLDDGVPSRGRLRRAVGERVRGADRDALPFPCTGGKGSTCCNSHSP